MKGVGIDLCSISRMERTLQTNEGFLKRYYTQEERAYIEGRGKMGAHSAAAMYAAKEAFLKAVGLGIGRGVRLDEIGVSHDANGAPLYALLGAAEEKLHALGAEKAFLSLSHEADVAAAVCVID